MTRDDIPLKTNEGPLKMDGWKMIHSLLKWCQTSGDEFVDFPGVETNESKNPEFLVFPCKHQLVAFSRWLASLREGSQDSTYAVELVEKWIHSRKGKQKTTCPYPHLGEWCGLVVIFLVNKNPFWNLQAEVFSGPISKQWRWAVVPWPNFRSTESWNCQ